MTTPNSKPDSDRDEDSLISGLLKSPVMLDDVALIVRVEMFRQDAAQKIYAALLDLYGRKPIDLRTIAAALNDRGDLENVGGSAKLADIFDLELTGGHSLHHAANVRDAFLRRSLAYLAADIDSEAHSPTRSAIEALEAAERALWALSELGADGQVTDLNADYNAILDSTERKRAEIDGLPTGLSDLDLLLCGLQDSQLVVIGARPSTGKTALGLTIARNLALAGYPVFFASIEQSKRELAERLVSGQAFVDGQKLRRGGLAPDAIAKISHAVHSLRKAPILANDSGVQTAQHIAANARRLKRKHGVRAVIVDYLQLVTPDDKRMKRYEQIGLISRRLKLLARELSIPVIALAQLNRGTEDRQEPKLSDLRDSGDIEQDADTVLLMNRPAKNQANKDNDGDVVEIDIHIAKHRNGPCGRIVLAFTKPYVTFGNMASSREDGPFRGVPA